MDIRLIEAGQTLEEGPNWGKFLVGRFEEDEWNYPSVITGEPLLRSLGPTKTPRRDPYTTANILVLDLQTGEGFFTRASQTPRQREWECALDRAFEELANHAVHTCVIFPWFLAHLYTLEDPLACHAFVELPQAPLGFVGARGARR